MLERITRREEADLFVAWVAISIAFAIIFIAPGGFLGSGLKVTPLAGVMFFIISFFTVGIGFILHEMAHKFSAIHFGFWAEFKKDDIMLLIAVVMAALVGFVFAAPGATVIYSNPASGGGITKRINGIISASGPVTNLLLCIPFAALLVIAGGKTGLESSNILSLIGIVGIQVNAMIAAFNLLPISVLDGKKVLAWNIPVFIVLIVAAFGLLVGSFYYL
jgi:Zn-dependent protease